MDLRNGILEAPIYGLSKLDSLKAHIIQEIPITLSQSVPTAWLRWNPKLNCFKIEINPEFFNNITAENRIAILEHEMAHFINGHPFRDFVTKEQDKMLVNFAMDLAINCYIKNLPQGCLYVEMFTDKNGKPFPPYLRYEEYLDLLKATLPPSKGGNRGEDKGRHPNEDVYDKYVPGKEDDHDFYAGEAENRSKLQEADRIIRRSLDKISSAFSKEQAKRVKELLEYIAASLRKLNTKELFKQALRRSVVKSERESTYNRPNRRVGYVAPGTRAASVPQLDLYVDTSGSMSVNELRRLVSLMYKLCGASAPNANLFLWHTSIYHKQKFNKLTQFNDIPWEQGGTDCTDAIKSFNKRNTDLTVILTDGHYDSDALPKGNNIIWVITDKQSPHPLKKFGKTVALEDLLQ
jgi:predicted metal-dependent peptidase